ncbi:MAG: hypothetical protein Q9170_003758 [Blastenia crenularia]
MSSLGVHSALETLLLLQGIQRSGADPLSLDSVSQTLKSSRISSRNETSDSEYLAPGTLKSLYLRLLKEEAKLASQSAIRSDPNQNGQESPCTRVPLSPPMETVEDALPFNYLIPQLATRVYNNYRESAIKSIEYEENKYRNLQKDIQEIERGEWDARLQHQDLASRKDSKGLASIRTLLQDDSDTNQSPSLAPDGPSPVPLPPVHQKTPTQSAPTRENLPHTVPYALGDHTIAIAGNAGAPLQESPPLAVASPGRPRQSHYASHELPSNAPRPSQSGSAENGVPFLPPPHHIQQGYRRTSPPAEIRRRQSSQPANIAPSPSTRPHQTPLPPPERSSGSPIILPPPPGMLRTTSSPSRPLDALADMAGQQYRSNAMPSPRLTQASNGVQHPVQLPLPSNYSQRPYQYPAYDNRSPYPNTYGPYHQGPLPAYPSQQYSHIPPYQHPTHTPGQSPYYASRPQYQSLVPSYPQYSPYSNTSSYTPQAPMPPSYAQYQTPRPLDQQNLTSTSGAKRKAPKPSPINTSVSSTKWKNVDLPEGSMWPRSPIRPPSEETSPNSARARSPVMEPADVSASAAVHQSRISPITEAADTPTIKPPAVRGRRGRPPRGTSNRGRGGRAASVASSAHPARTRSASVASGADELSLEPPTSASQYAAIKAEPPATPARDSSASIPPPATTDTDRNRKSTRRRRDTLRGLDPTTENVRTSTKRKRTIDTLDPDHRSTTRSDLDKQKDELSKTHILASRNLPRTSATLINDITAHKLASIFAKPLTEREAPGYHSLIYRPQDLKSIKQAITMGNRALAAIVEQERDADGNDKAIIRVAGASESDMRVWVKKNEDVVPPKGIVNSAQLEREIMRVFANAVMFNPDPDRGFGPASRTRARRKERHVPVHLAKDEDEEEEGDGDEDGREEEEGGVVKDTREMFEDVERVVAEWRAAEKAAEEAAARMGTAVGKLRAGEEEEADELAGEDESGIVDEEVAGGERVGKRRRR